MTEREKFEAWAKSYGYDTSIMEGTDSYEYIQSEFNGWQAALASRPADTVKVVELNVSTAKLIWDRSVQNACNYYRDDKKTFIRLLRELGLDIPESSDND